MTIVPSAVLETSYQPREPFISWLAYLDAQLAHRGVLVQQGGGIIDAFITPMARKPQSKSTEVLPEYPDISPTKEVKPGVDQ
jgi:hypothetical protein